MTLTSLENDINPNITSIIIQALKRNGVNKVINSSQFHNMYEKGVLEQNSIGWDH